MPISPYFPTVWVTKLYQPPNETSDMSYFRSPRHNYLKTDCLSWKEHMKQESCLKDVRRVSLNAKLQGLLFVYSFVTGYEQRCFVYLLDFMNFVIKSICSRKVLCLRAAHQLFRTNSLSKSELQKSKICESFNAIYRVSQYDSSNAFKTCLM